MRFALFLERSLRDLVNVLLAQSYEEKTDRDQYRASKSSVPSEIEWAETPVIRTVSIP
jgi:hypothetical protein